MKSWLWFIALCSMLGLSLSPAFAAELRATGFIDNVFPRWEKNASNGDNDPTRGNDNAFFGRTRFRSFFNFIASDDLRGVFAIELDGAYGEAASDRISSVGNFDNGIDNLAIEVKQAYVDFRVPQLPVGNRWRFGGLPFNVTPLHSASLYTMDAGGGDVRFDLTDQASVLLYYAQLEEDLDRFTGSTKIGEDYITGTTLMLKPISGLDLHLLGVYNHGQAPFGSSLTGGGGPFNGIAQDARNVSTEDRYYVGFDARYRMGNTSIEPGFVYLLGTRKFTAASAAATGVDDTDFSGFHGFVKVSHAMGPWLLAARGAYVSGNEANDDINNRGIGDRSDVKGFRFLGVDSSHYLGEWFELLGKSDVDSTGQRSFRRMGEIANLEGFGWVIIGGHVEYKSTEKLTITGSAGGFWTAEETACRSNFRLGSITGPCTGPNSPLNSSGSPALDFTGGSKFVGWEVNAGFRYTIMPGLTWTPLLAYADYGDALETNNRSAKDAWAFVNRMIYIF